MSERQHNDDLFAVVRAGDIDAKPISQNWLIEELWTSSAVGWVAGQPKSLKSWTALEMAVSVATGTAFLGHYSVKERGPTLVYLAEDSLPAVRERLVLLAKQHGVDIDELDVHVITASSMRLDLGRDQVRLQKTARALSPRLLILDPLVRIHRADENSSGEVSTLLAYLRELQRELDLAIVVVHHVRKSGASSQAAGQGLRGSGDLHAWSDSALYLRPKRGDVTVTVEHRSAPTPSPFSIRLSGGVGDSPCFEFVAALSREVATGQALTERVLATLSAAPSPLTRATLREELSVRNERLGQALDQLVASGSIERKDQGWQLSAATDDDRSAFPPIGMNGNGTIHEAYQGGDNVPGEEEIPW